MSLSFDTTLVVAVVIIGDFKQTDAAREEAVTFKSQFPQK